jgi:hypothetical protein
MANQAPGDGFMGWLGRQIGYVKGAVKPKAGGAPAQQQQQALPQQGEGGMGGAATPQANSQASPAAGAAGQPATNAVPPPQGAVVPQVVYREEKVEEIEHPERPGVVLRRTVIDEAIVDPQKAGGGNG